METRHFVGTDKDGTRFYAEIDLAESGTPVEFTDHSTGTLTQVFSASGFAIERGRRESCSAGQMLDDLTTITTPAPGWTADDIASLVSVWRDWHLNNMSAASDEQREQAEAVGYDYDKIAALGGLVDSTGYRYGTKWLARQLPAEVVAEIRRLQSLPTGKVPTTY